MGNTTVIDIVIAIAAVDCGYGRRMSSVAALALTQRPLPANRLQPPLSSNVI